jgi:hypothetical protein
VMSPCSISSMTTAATVARERPVRAASCERLSPWFELSSLSTSCRLNSRSRDVAGDGWWAVPIGPPA